MSPAESYMDLLVEAHDALTQAIDALHEAGPMYPHGLSLADDLEDVRRQLEREEVPGVLDAWVPDSPRGLN